MPQRDFSPSQDTRGHFEPRDLFPRPASSRPSAPPARDTLSASARSRDLARDLRELRPLTTHERTMIHAVGQFRTIAAADLARVPGSQTDHSIRTMKELGLLRSHWIPSPETKEARRRDHTTKGFRRPTVPTATLHVVTLTRKGAAWLRSDGYDERTTGRLHSGLSKPREVFHDSRLYALGLSATASLRDAGCTPLAMHTDALLKARLQSETHRLLRTGMPKQDAQEAAALALSIPVIDGKAVIPDLRVEYERADGERVYSDLELLSDSYSKAAVATKSAAGFVSYTAGKGGGFTPKGGKSPWDPDHMARLLGR